MTDRWHRWLLDRATHREPVDAHFANAFTWLRTTPPAAFSPILELGPGPEFDLTDTLRAEGRDVWTADVAPARSGPQDIDLSDQIDSDYLPFEAHSLGTVLAREVLEHVAELPLMLQELDRIIMPGGRLWFSAPFIFPLHDFDTGDYWRITAPGWEHLFRSGTGFKSWKVWHDRFLWESWQLPISVLGWAEK